MSAAAKVSWTPQDTKTELCTLFENAPGGLAQCRRDGSITALNSVMERMLRSDGVVERARFFSDLLPQENRAHGERLFSELFERERNSFQMDSQGADANSLHWTVWRVSGTADSPDCALAWAEDGPKNHEAEQRLRQAQRLEAVGRLAGGVAHDFNNLLTGVMLYCDLLMAHLEPCHRVRKYAEEIRNAGMQATGLVRQLLAVSRPTNSEPRLLSLNEIAEGMRNLLVRLIGETIELKFSLDPNLGLIKMDPTQSQQILLNLVLNARDAMPTGGQITVETSNCNVQVLTESISGASPASLPCALFVVGDNGSGMDDATRAHLFEAFFTTKGGKGTGLGLATVHDIVSSNGGLIHVESAPSRGTRVSVLLPLVPQAFLHTQEAHDFHPETIRGVLIPKE
jgi:two-component system, cell cycle sensor histidine kinase and response regulator CckA